MKKVIYYARICYLDAALEYLKTIGKLYDVHLLIGISPNERQENIVDIDSNLDQYKTFVAFDEISTSWRMEKLNYYFSDLKSVNFVVYKNEKKIIEFLSVGLKITSFILKIKPDYVHFDDFSFRQSVLIPYIILNRKKIIMNIHDPKPHSGESIGYINILKKILYKVIPKFVTFSEYSKSILEKVVPVNTKIITLKFLPYSIYKNNEELGSKRNESNKAITFLGRLSVYKGLEIFAKTVHLINQKFPDQKFIIAGKSVYDYDVSYLYDLPNTLIKNYFISNTEIREILINSQLVICPYVDATQSGVVMTSYALHVPVIVSNVGGLPEYVENGKTGLILENNNADELSQLISDYLEKDMYQKFHEILLNDHLQIMYRTLNIPKIQKYLYTNT